MKPAYAVAIDQIGAMTCVMCKRSTFAVKIGCVSVLCENLISVDGVKMLRYHDCPGSPPPPPPRRTPKEAQAEAERRSKGRGSKNGEGNHAR
jgi:hypothetical protein